jgi:hypothetical protein
MSHNGKYFLIIKFKLACCSEIDIIIAVLVLFYLFSKLSSHYEYLAFIKQNYKHLSTLLESKQKITMSTQRQL